MLRDSCMCVKAVDYIKHGRKVWRLLRKIRSASAAENHDVNFICPLLYLCDLHYRNSLCQDAHTLRVSAGKYSRKLHIRILTDGALHASSKISVT